MATICFNPLSKSDSPPLFNMKFKGYVFFDYVGTTPISWANIPLTDTNISAEDKEVFDAWKSNTTNSNSQGIQSPVIPGLPRPPSRKDITSSNSSRISAGR